MLSENNMVSLRHYQSRINYKGVYVKETKGEESKTSVLVGTALVLFGKDEKEIIELLNSNLLNDIQFKQLFKNKSYNEDFMVAKKTVNREDFYKNVLDTTRIQKTLTSLKQGSGKNVVIDYSNEFSELLVSPKALSKQKAVDYFFGMLNKLMETLGKAGYTRVVFASTMNAEGELFPSKMDSFLSYMLTAIKLNMVSKFVSNTKINTHVSRFIMLENSSKYYTSLTLNEFFQDKEKQSKLISSVKALKNKSVKSEVSMTEITATAGISSRDIQYQERAISDKLPSYIFLPLNKVVQSDSVLFTSLQNALAFYLANYTEVSFKTEEETLSTGDYTFLKQEFSLYQVGEYSQELRPKIVAGKNFKSELLMEFKNLHKLLSDVKKLKDHPYLNPHVIVFNISKESFDNRVSVSDAISEFRKYITKLSKGSSPIPSSRLEKKLESDLLELALNIASNVNYDGSITRKELYDNILTDPKIIETSELLAKARTSTLASTADNTLIENLRLGQDLATITIDGKEKNITDVINKGNVVLHRELKVKGVREEKLRSAVSCEIDKRYYADDYQYDMVSIFSSFGKVDEKSPIFVKNIEMVDTSDDFSLQDTAIVTFAIPKGRPVKLKIDVPKLTADGYLFMNGSKKTISKQITTLPILKMKVGGEDAVQFATNYKKVFIERNGNRMSPSLTKLSKIAKKAVMGEIKDLPRAMFLAGDASFVNKEYLINLEFNEISKNVIQFNSPKYKINFNRKETEGLLESYGFDSNDFKDSGYGLFCIGFTSTKLPIVADQSGEVFVLNSAGIVKEMIAPSIQSLIRSEINVTGKVDYDTLASQEVTGKKFTYTTIKVLATKLPLLTFLSYRRGLLSILEEYGVDFEFSDKRLKDNSRAEFKFADGFLYCDTSKVKHSLLVSGLNEMETSEHPIDEFKAGGDAYLDMFYKLGVPKLSVGIDNMYSLFIDPITKDVLDELNQPSEMVEALLYCNTLLESSILRKKNDMSNYRVRGMESINAMLYRVIADSVQKYRQSGLNPGANVKLSVPQNALMREIEQSPIIETASVLNPVREAESIGKTTFKGPGAPAYGNAKGTEEIRAYDRSMMGLLTPTTSDDSNVGITRYLAMNPILKGRRGLIGSAEVDIKDLNATNLYSVGDLMSPFTATHSDPPRMGMANRQTQHMIPTVKQHPMLIGSGMEKSIAYYISDNFVFRTKQAGVIEKIDLKSEVAIIRYDDDTTAAVDLATKNGRSPDGFFITVQMEHDLKVGKRFDEGEILTWDKNYFKKTANGEITMMPGRLSRIALAGSDATFEDSSLITAELADDIGSEITYLKEVAIAANSNLEFVAKKGSEIKSSQPLVIFEETFGEDSDAISKMLARMGDDFTQGIEEHSKTSVNSKYTGKILEMQVYYNRPMEELSPSIQKFLNEYLVTVSRRRKIIEKTRKDHIISSVPVEQIEAGKKVKGIEFDGILILFYVRTIDKFTAGSKITFDKALKSIVSTVLEEGEEPYYIDKKGNKLPVDSCLSMFSTSSRMVSDFFLSMWTNSVLITLKDDILDIADKD
jgi:hypothetical protein